MFSFKFLQYSREFSSALNGGNQCPLELAIFESRSHVAVALFHGLLVGIFLKYVKTFGYLTNEVSVRQPYSYQQPAAASQLFSFHFQSSYHKLSSPCCWFQLTTDWPTIFSITFDLPFLLRDIRQTNNRVNHRPYRAFIVQTQFRSLNLMIFQILDYLIVTHFHSLFTSNFLKQFPVHLGSWLFDPYGGRDSFRRLFDLMINRLSPRISCLCIQQSTSFQWRPVYLDY